MEKRKPNEEGGKVWIEREGKRGKGQQSVGTSGGDKGKDSAVEDKNAGSGMARAVA